MLDDLIAQLMPIGIVDLLEQIDVDEKESPTLIMLFCEMLGYQLLKERRLRVGSRDQLGSLE